MSSLYRPLPELIFSTPWFRRLSANAKLIVLTLAAGPCMTGCPGLAVADTYLLVSLTGLAVADVQAALDEMTAAKVLEVDDDHRLIRLPWLPAMRRTKSYKDLIGWWKCFVERPACALRDAHVASLRDAVDFGGEQMESTWAQTLGGKPSGTHSQAHGKPSDTPTDHGDGDGDGDGDGTEEEITADAATPALKLVVGEAKKPKRAPLPYSVDQLQATLVDAARGAFISVPLDRGPTIAAQKIVRAYTLDQVRLAGEWLAAGGEKWREPLDSRNLRDLKAWVAHSEAWNTKGRPPLDRPKEEAKRGRVRQFNDGIGAQPETKEEEF